MPFNKKEQVSVEELEEKLQKQMQAIEAYRDEIKLSHSYKMERDLYSELAVIFANAANFDDVFKKTLETLSKHLNAKYYGVFWINEQTDSLTYRIGKGYTGLQQKSIPCKGSMMGECLFRGSVIWEQKFSSRTDYIRLEQNPDEYNVLCAPLVLAGKNAGVVRIANIDPVFTSKVSPIMQTVTQMLCSSLERILYHEQNESTLKILDASYSIVKMLKNTVDKKEILKQVSHQVNNVFRCAGCVITLADQNGKMNSQISWPENFILTGNAISGSIYLRNLIEHYSNGSCLIPNIHADKNFLSWADPKIQSLCMVPLRIKDRTNGFIIAVGPAGETYTSNHMKLLDIIASQTSMTLERAVYFAMQEDLAQYDGLTGLYNRRMFQQLLYDECNRVKRYKSSLSMLMFDIDHFKKINDTFGHQTGDDVIKMVTGTIKTMIRSTDRACRYGGEEFVVLLPETNRENGSVLAERIRKQIESNRSIGGMPVTVSCGISEYNPSDTSDNFLKRADEALYSAKENGRNRVVTR